MSRRLVVVLLPLAVGTCVPKSFTYSDAEGGGGAGGGGLCGNGVVDAGEACDTGATTDDFEDEAVAPAAAPDACSKTCRDMVAWSWRDADGTTESMAFGITAVPGGYVVGGTRGVGLDPLDLTNIQYSGERVLVRLTPEGVTDTVFDATSTGDDSNAILGLTALADGTVIALESEHNPNNWVRTYLARWESGVQTQRSVPVGSAEGAFAQLTTPDPAGTVLAVGRQIDGKLHVVGFTSGGSSSDNTVFSPPAGATGAVAFRSGGAYVVWDRGGRVLDAQWQPVASFDVEAEITAGCGRPDGTAVFAGWSDPGPGYDSFVIVVGPLGEILHKETRGGPDGGWDGVNAVACAPDGSFVVAGQETIDPVNPQNLAFTQALLRRYRADFSLAWTRTHRSPITSMSGDVSTTAATGVAIDADGSVLVSGREMVNQDTAVAWARKYAP